MELRLYRWLVAGSVILSVLSVTQRAAAQAQPDVNIANPPSLDLQRMMQAIELMKQSRERVGGQPQPVATEAGEPAALPPSPPPLPATLPSELPPVAAEPPVDLPGELTPFTEPPPLPPAASEGQAPIPGLEGGPGLPSPGLMLGTDDKALQNSPEFQEMLKIFGDDPGLATRSITMRAQTLAINFIDYLFRRDRERVRALVGVPFYADNFPVDTEADLNKLMGPVSAITGPPKPIPDDRKDDELIGASVMQIEELRNTEFYIGDRGADLVGLKPDDFFIHLVFLRNGEIAPMVIYVRRVGDDSLEVAGFYD